MQSDRTRQYHVQPVLMVLILKHHLPRPARSVGYSYTTDNSSVDNSPVAAEDVCAFLQLFLAKYPKYADAPFHIAASNY